MSEQNKDQSQPKQTAQPLGLGRSSHRRNNQNRHGTTGRPGQSRRASRNI